MEIASYNFHLGLLRPEPFGWIPQSLLGSSRGRRRYDISYRTVGIDLSLDQSGGATVQCDPGGIAFDFNSTIAFSIVANFSGIS
jgi:hypothetical protein